MPFTVTSAPYSPFLKSSGPEKTHTPSIGAHKINRFSTAMIRRPRTSTVPRAVNLPHSPRPRRHNGIRPAHGNGLARAHGRNRRRAVPAEAGGARAAALHGAGARALVGDGGAGAVGGPAAVAGGTVGAGRFGTAFYVGGISGAAAGDGGAA